MKKQEKFKTYILLVILMVFFIPSSVSLTYIDVALGATDEAFWNLDLTFQNSNGTVLNGTQAVFAPFELITLRAEITNATIAIPESTVVFNIKGPSSTAQPTEIICSNVTDNNNATSIEFRLPIENTEKITGQWQVYVNVKTANTVLTQNTTFQVTWPTQNITIDFKNTQGQNQTNFNAEDNVTAIITYENNRQQTQNISLNIKDTANNTITQQTLQITANATKNNIVTFEFTIPKNTPNGTAQANINIYSEIYQNRTIQTAENKTATFKIGNTTDTPNTTPTPTPTPDKENAIKWLPWLTAITAIITFIILVIFLKRKNNKLEETETNTAAMEATPTIPQTPLTTSKDQTTPFSEVNSAVSLLQMQAILNQISQPDKATQDTTTLVTQLNNIAITAKKIQELQISLKIEQEQLNKNVNDLNQTIEKQEKIIKNYYDTIRNEVKKAQKTITEDKSTTGEQKEDKN
jgi:hypothetical protein